MSVAVEERRVAPDTSSFLLRYQPGRDLPEVSSPGEAAPAQVARLNSAVAVFDGHVFDKEALAAISGADPASADAELALRAYFESGSAVLGRIDGVFALVIDRIVDEYGPDHEKVFVIQVFWNGETFAYGRGASKREAQRKAAKEALKKLGRLPG